ncbi:MAG: RpiB/LacA/LacB family sugar-phosphate isomerase [Alphaproteobacteria bacterium]|nr:RpiB/LacA/LacB family sugar-phosphate isomerase [Alphaproteobacteria bacterium]
MTEAPPVATDILLQFSPAADPAQVKAALQAVNGQQAELVRAGDAEAVLSGAARFGVLVCGSGIGMAITANRHPGIRATVLHNTTEARLTRAHNDANIACFGGRTLGVEVALDCLLTFLATPYEGGRHDRRIAKIESPSA